MFCALEQRDLRPEDCSSKICDMRDRTQLAVCFVCEQGKQLAATAHRGGAGHDARDEVIANQMPAEDPAPPFKNKEKIMKNTLADLNNHLFAQLERLSDESISSDSLALEIRRSKAIADISREVISNASLVLKAHSLAAGGAHGDLPKMLEGGK